MIQENEVDIQQFIQLWLSNYFHWWKNIEEVSGRNIN